MSAKDSDDCHSEVGTIFRGKTTRREESIDDNVSEMSEESTTSKTDYGRRQSSMEDERIEEHNYAPYEDEKARVQKKVFMNWINYYVPNCIKSDIVQELRDGSKLLQLMTALTGQKFEGEKARKMRRYHYISNVNKVLKYLEKERKINLVNIHATEIVDGNPCNILGLIWMIILHFHIEEYVQLAQLETKHVTNNKSEDDSKGISSMSFPATEPRTQPDPRLGVRQMLLDQINDRFGLNVKDFGPSWRDGQALLKMIDAIDPDLYAFNRGNSMASNVHRLGLGFDLADKHLGIQKYLDPEDLDVDKPDERSVMTYVSQFLQKQAYAKPKEELELIKRVADIQAKAPLSSAASSAEDEARPKADAIKKWVGFVVSTGINRLNIDGFQEQFKQLSPDFETCKALLDSLTISNWNRIKDELQIGNQLLDWISSATQIIESYGIPGSGEEVLDQLQKHYQNFKSVPAVPPGTTLLGSIIDEYNQCLKLVRDWEAAMMEASKRWAKYNASKDQLVNWIVDGEKLLQKVYEAGHEATTDDFMALKAYFGDRQANEAILLRFTTDCDEVLETLPESHQGPLRDMLKALEARFHDINNNRAPSHLIRLEFNLIEQDFLKNVNKDPAIEEEILEQLDRMEALGTTFWKMFADKSLLESASDHRRQWEARKRPQIPSEIVLVKEETMKMIYESQVQIESITIRSHIEIIRDNENILKNIRMQTQVLRKLSLDQGVDIEKDLKEIEKHLETLSDLLNVKKKEKVLNWLDKEVPMKLERAKSFGEVDVLRKDVESYRELVEETELVKRIDLVDVQTKLIDVEINRVNSIPEAELKLAELKALKVKSPELETRVRWLENEVLEEWKAIEEAKNDLKMWMATVHGDPKVIKEKEIQVRQLQQRFTNSEHILRQFASDFAVEKLRSEIDKLTNDYKQLVENIRDYENKLKQRNEISVKLDRVESWVRGHSINSVVPEDCPSFNEALNHIKTAQLEWQNHKHDLQKVDNQLQTGLDDKELSRRCSNLSFQLNSYDWSSLINYQKTKFKALREAEEEFRRSKDKLDTILGIVDQIEAKYREICPDGDSLQMKREQLEVAETLRDQLDEMGLEEVPVYQKLKSDYQSLLARCQHLQERINHLVLDKRSAVGDHARFNESCQKFSSWMQVLRDIIPPPPKDSTNLEIHIASLSNLLSQKSVGDYKLSEIKNLGLIASEKTSELGRQSIERTIIGLEKEYLELFKQIDKTHQEARKLESNNLQLKTSYQQMIDNLQNLKSEIKMLPLQKTLVKKEDQLKELESLLDKLNQQEPEIRRLKEEYEQPSKRTFGDIELLFNEVLVALQFQISRWKKYVKHHSDFESILNQAKVSNETLKNRIKQIERIDDKKERRRLIDELLNNRDDENVFRKLEEQLKVVNGETASEGADMLSRTVKQVLQQREALLNQLMELKKSTEQLLMAEEKYQNLLERIKLTLDDIEREAVNITVPCGSLKEKESNMNKAINLKSKCDGIGVYEFPAIPEVKDDFETILIRFEKVKIKLEKAVEICQNAYNTQLKYQEAAEKFRLWLRNLRDQIPALEKKDLLDRALLERSLSIHNQLKSQKPDGNSRLDEVKSCASETLPYCDDQLTSRVSRELEDLEERFLSLFIDIDNNVLFLKDALGVLDEREYLLQVLNEVRAWIKDNPADEILCKLPLTSISFALDEMELRKMEWQQQKDKLAKVHEILKNGQQDEDLIKIYADLAYQIESYDWEQLIRELSFKLRDLIETEDINDNLHNVVKQINALIDTIYYSYEIEDVLPRVDTLEEKKAQLEFVEDIKRTIDKINLDNVPPEEVLTDNNDTIKWKLDQLKSKLAQLLEEKRKAFTELLVFNKTCTNFVAWMQTLRSKIPTLSEDASNVESFIATLTYLESQRPVGEKKLKDIRVLGEMTARSSSKAGQKSVHEVIENLERDHECLFNEMSVSLQKSKQFKYETLKVKANLYKKVSDWLQGLEKEIQTLPLAGSLMDKRNQLTRLKTLEEELLLKESSIKSAIEKGRKDSNSQVSKYLTDIEAKYKDSIVCIRTQVEKWETYVQHHQELESLIEQTRAINERLNKALVDPIEALDIDADKEYGTISKDLRNQYNVVSDETAPEQLSHLSVQVNSVLKEKENLMEKLMNLESERNKAYSEASTLKLEKKPQEEGSPSSSMPGPISPSEEITLDNGLATSNQNKENEPKSKKPDKKGSLLSLVSIGKSEGKEDSKKPPKSRSSSKIRNPFKLFK